MIIVLNNGVCIFDKLIDVYVFFYERWLCFFLAKDMILILFLLSK